MLRVGIWRQAEKSSPRGRPIRRKAMRPSDGKEGAVASQGRPDVRRRLGATPLLLAQAQDFPEDFHIKALTLGLCKDFLLALVQRLDLFVDVFNAIDKGANAIARDSCRVGHACSLSKRHTPMQRKEPAG